MFKKAYQYSEETLLNIMRVLLTPRLFRLFSQMFKQTCQIPRKPPPLLSRLFKTYQYLKKTLLQIKEALIMLWMRMYSAVRTFLGAAFRAALH